MTMFTFTFTFTFTTLTTRTLPIPSHPILTTCCLPFPPLPALTNATTTTGPGSPHTLTIRSHTILLPFAAALVLRIQ
ncbi:hypothetical protein BU24DRAFT_427176 [Aaosphaeria arxii CBS 175.79]|uniref:Uncharacterized protein n=1 Tax=Aaosphaeria arxii CBS 175.79 TaxID=1450172 RepID=A0A6A5XCY7_9PLEO|nr:uncharacterized protein BU24DRAFT_427176 [Aaosphaeria arxii CBS 175.79]KAF2010975.1 hypothetical protein BU24DRAFT_427176 [Aaosphaeria arxii CBS 175.79]